MHFRAGDGVQVRTQEEIASTLDGNGMFEGVPFMPEMRKYCGKKFRVYKRADKICVEDLYVGIRRMRNAVFLEDVRCDGDDHDGCARLCLAIWKEAWLQPIPRGASLDRAQDIASSSVPRTFPPVDPEKSYFCQSTTLKAATETLRGWDVRQYYRDLVSRTMSPLGLIAMLGLAVYNRISRTSGGKEFGAVTGEHVKTPAVSLNLSEGDVVEVKDREGIAATLDSQGKNRGLSMSYEMLRHSGRKLRVIKRIDRMILENTGKMREIRNTVLLDQTECSGVCLRGCARGSFPMWREAWLTKADAEKETPLT